MKRWDESSGGEKIGRIAIIATVIALLFWNPYTRAVILVILPLGSGLDDVIFLLALSVAVTLWVIKFLRRKDRRL